MKCLSRKKENFCGQKMSVSKSFFCVLYDVDIVGVIGLLSMTSVVTGSMEWGFFTPHRVYTCYVCYVTRANRLGVSRWFHRQGLQPMLERSHHHVTNL